MLELIILYLVIGMIFSFYLINTIEEAGGEKAYKSEMIFPVFFLGLVWPVLLVLKVTVK